MLDLNYTVTKC